MKYRDLEKARVIIKEATDLDVSYAYDDLVFPDHTAFIIKFDDGNDNNFFCYFHEDCITGEQKKISENLVEACKNNKCSITFGGKFNLEQKGESVNIRFN